MKKLNSLIVFCFIGFTALAQTTVQNFTKNDCNGNAHDLFTELNSGKVIILEYIMTNCSPCVTAGNGLKSIVADYAISHPGRVSLYAIGYDDSYTCSDMNNWKTTNNLSSHTVFTQGASDVTYYGGMGMPTIVIAGGWSHQIFYKKLGFAPSDNTPIRTALNNALLAAGVSPVTSPAFVIYPNPATHAFTIQLTGEHHTISVTDCTGKTVFSEHVNGNTPYTCEANLNPGLYLVTVSNENGTSVQKLIIQ